MGFKATVGSITRTWQRRMCYTITSGATPADLLAASMTAKPISTCEQALVKLKTRTYCATDQCSTD